ncbi:MAG: acyltransferase [Bacteroidaceae bacterium]|nr:acyltransferase [Bacteroidaceae bacterium]
MLATFFKISNKTQSELQKLWNKYKIKFYGNQIVMKSGTIKGPVYIRLRKTGKLIIGNNFYCVSGCCYNPIARNIRTSFCTEENAVIEIGDNVGISSSSIRAFERITIGNNVNIGADCIIIDSDAHSLNYEDRRDGTLDKQNRKSRPIVIEDDVLIGTRSIILKGVTIGARSIIGAGSVVTCNVPSDEIWAGNPARFVKKLTRKQ